MKERFSEHFKENTAFSVAGAKLIFMRRKNKGKFPGLLIIETDFVISEYIILLKTFVDSDRNN